MKLIDQSAAYIRTRLAGHAMPHTAIILGSGLGLLADRIENPIVIPYADIPNFRRSTAVGHKGNLIVGTLGGECVMAMQGRFHYYEGYTMQEVTFPVRVMARLGIKTLLVSNAGIAGQMQIQDVPEESWDRYFGVNVKGAYNAVQAVLPDMLHAHAGAIVTVSSMWGLRGASCEVVYSATKAALIGLTRSLAMELAPSGIRVNCVAPGVIDTDMVQVLGRETLEQLAREIPLGRLGKPREIAQTVLYLAENPYITGQVVTVDGGFLA